MLLQEFDYDRSHVLDAVLAHEACCDVVLQHLWCVNDIVWSHGLRMLGDLFKPAITQLEDVRGSIVLRKLNVAGRHAPKWCSLFLKFQALRGKLLQFDFQKTLREQSVKTEKGACDNVDPLEASSFSQTGSQAGISYIEYIRIFLHACICMGLHVGTTCSALILVSDRSWNALLLAYLTDSFSRDFMGSSSFFSSSFFGGMAA